MSLLTCCMPDSLGCDLILSSLSFNDIVVDMMCVRSSLSLSLRENFLFSTDFLIDKRSFASTFFKVRSGDSCYAENLTRVLCQAIECLHPDPSLISRPYHHRQQALIFRPEVCYDTKVTLAWFSRYTVNREARFVHSCD
jgi:hypothetical protein